MGFRIELQGASEESKASSKRLDAGSSSEDEEQKFEVTQRDDSDVCFLMSN